MELISRFLNSIFFWSAWLIIPFMMEILPSFFSAIHLFLKRTKKKVRHELTKYPEISLIIPVYNSQDSLLRCIGSIHDSDYPNDSIRIFLVNNKTKDDSFKIYQEAQNKFPELEMQWLNAENGKSRALNMALYNTFGKYIINIDSDGFLEKNALKNIITDFEEDESIGSMTGTIMTDPEEIESYKGFFSKLLRQLEFVEYAQAFLAGRSFASDRNALYTLSGAFSAFRKSAILKSYLYNTNTIAEDTHITFQMAYNLGLKVKLCDDAIYFVGPIENTDKLYTQRQRWQRGSLEVSKLFFDKKMKFTHFFTDVNVRTMMYDHTFAFPRIIWYFALIALCLMGYSTKLILFSTLFIFLLYIINAYLYFWEICIFLKKFPELRKYYISQWWVVALLPFFNFIVFFIRFLGILNSENTVSAWKTHTFSEEKSMVYNEIFKKQKNVRKFITSVRKFANN